ncbi:Calcium-transporting ATPase 9 plasma membrane-type [Zea mays]|uniref:Calcium-transporting ATPase n=1 Tax=Zea mays TaxID=4577 RepID=A0A1D6H232_MAIZE|nr:Calcium-transporting ATPase 9 plasma membrane-type [Zea mays]
MPAGGAIVVVEVVQVVVPGAVAKPPGSKEEAAASTGMKSGLARLVRRTGGAERPTSAWSVAGGRVLWARAAIPLPATQIPMGGGWLDNGGTQIRHGAAPRPGGGGRRAAHWRVHDRGGGEPVEAEDEWRFARVTWRLTVRLNGVATFIGIAGLSVAAMVLVVLFARYFTGHTTDSDGSVQFVKRHTSVKSAIFGSIKILTVAVTIVVVAVPEGLPLAVTLTLAYSMRKMMADKALVRRLSACETMGSATTICSDKTGTLTLNQMTVMQSIVGEVKLQPPANVDKLSSTVASLLLEGIAQNTSGSVFEAQDGSVEVTGSPTEKAILSWGLDLRMKFAEERSRSSIIHVSPFNSEKKRAGVAVVARDSNVHVHWKGAAEIVLALCTSWLNVDGSTHEMTPDKANQLKKLIEDMAEQSLRCIAFAYRNLDMKDVPSEEQRINWQLPDNELTLIGIIGMKDPCRPEVRDAVELCKKAGVKVRMVTGDNLKTAKAIALECGILDDSEASAQAIIEGRVFRAYDDTERENVADKISVMARSSPNDKLLLVKALKKIGHVVAVTGDGTNDAPALHEADIGLSMGIQGTEVAKESSDIIILDDNFSSVVKVVRWGRSVYANIQKFIQFQLTVNVAALVINVVAAVSSGNVPLNAVQLLWVNLIMDTLGALALATEPPTDQLMRRPPVGRREPLVTNIMWRNLFIQAVFQVAVLLTLNFRGRDLLHLTHDTLGHSSKVKNTLIFNTFVLCQVFNEVNSRKPEELNIFSGVSRNHLFLAVVSITVVMQVIIIEFLGKFTSTVRLNWKLWLVSVVIAFLSWPLAFVGKFIPVPRTELKDLIVRCWPKRKDLTFSSSLFFWLGIGTVARVQHNRLRMTEWKYQCEAVLEQLLEIIRC